MFNEKFKQKSVIAWIIFNVLRLVPTVLFGAFFFLFYFFKWAVSDKKRYNEKKLLWEKAKTDLESLRTFFGRHYEYKWDLGKGFFDHDSSIFEWIFGYGDCDDMGLYSKKALKSMGYEAYRIGLLGMSKWKPTSKHNLKPILHFDSLFVERDENKNIIKASVFNYGSVITASSIEEVIDKFSSSSWSTSFPKDHTKVCICLY